MEIHSNETPDAQGKSEEIKILGELESQAEESPIDQDNSSDETEDIVPLNLEIEAREQVFTKALAGLDSKEIVKKLKEILESKSVEQLRDEVDLMKIAFYKRHKSEIEASKKLFVESGGIIEDFQVQESTEEQELKLLIKKYKEQKHEHTQKLEAIKLQNLKEKTAILEEIKELPSKEGLITDIHKRFKALVDKWKTIGTVPQANVSDLYENYHHNVDKFYDFLKLNKELRDLDLKKNLQLKTELCLAAEKQIMESSVVKSFKTLQDLHVQWREIGTVPNENRVEIWDRFKAATAKINKAHQEYFENLKESQKKNLDLKTNICDKIEEVLQQEISTVKEWDEKTAGIVELQELWKTIGFAPRKQNTEVYQRFHNLCDDFFNRKRDFYSKIKDDQNANLQLKLDICFQAEALKESTEWKKTSDELIQLQKRWKDIGPVPKKHSDSIWKRFRLACDSFFNAKNAHFASVDNEYENNLKLKEALLIEIENFQLGGDADANFNSVKEFQQRWSEIGFVPIAKKEDIQKKYRKLVDQLFDQLKMDDGKKNLLKFKNKVDSMGTSIKGDNRLKQEREKYIHRVKKLESDILLWENNIGFFAKSKNAEAMINEVQKRIEEAKAEMKSLEEKISMIEKSKIE